MDATLTSVDLIKIALAAGCDPRTVKAFLEGRTQAATTQSRIAKALEDLGYRKPRKVGR